MFICAALLASLQIPNPGPVGSELGGNDFEAHAELDGHVAKTTGP